MKIQLHIRNGYNLLFVHIQYFRCTISIFLCVCHSLKSSIAVWSISRLYLGNDFLLIRSMCLRRALPRFPIAILLLSNLSFNTISNHQTGPRFIMESMMFAIAYGKNCFATQTYHFTRRIELSYSGPYCMSSEMSSWKIQTIRKSSI